MSSGASSSLCGCHSPVGGRVCSLVVRVKAPRSVYKLWCEVGRIGILSLGVELLSIPPQELCEVACHLLCRLRNTLLLALPPAPPQLWECRRSAWMSHRCCACNATSVDSLAQICWSQALDSHSWAPGPAVGTTAQTPALPPRVTKPTATNLDLPCPQEHQ